MSIIRQINPGSAGFAQFRNSGALIVLLISLFIFPLMTLSGTDFSNIFLNCPSSLNFTPRNFYFFTGICAVSASARSTALWFLRLQSADFLVCRFSDFEDRDLAADSNTSSCWPFLFQFHVHRSILATALRLPFRESRAERVDDVSVRISCLTAWMPPSAYPSAPVWCGSFVGNKPNLFRAQLLTTVKNNNRAEISGRRNAVPSSKSAWSICAYRLCGNTMPMRKLTPASAAAAALKMPSFMVDPPTDRDNYGINKIGKSHLFFIGIENPCGTEP